MSIRQVCARCRKRPAIPGREECAHCAGPSPFRMERCDCETCKRNRGRRMSANVVVLEAGRGE